ncbi:MAG: hypothetical protein ABI691_12125 [Ginsengibacter sp.]
MASTNNTQKTPVKNHYKFFYDEVTKRKIERHLSDINDTISDEDIMNVITDITSDYPAGRNAEAGYVPAKEPVLTANEQIPTSWNIAE